MNVEVAVLALASALRPTALAAVYALLAGSRPLRCLGAFILAGLGFSIATGILAVAVIHGAHLKESRTGFDPILELVAGTAALGFAAGLYSGRVQRRPRDEPAPRQSRVSRALRHPSVAMAAAAGVATHLPGLFYLVGLNSIVAEGHGVTRGITTVLVFNAIWWSIPIASLVFFVLRAEATRHTLARINAWARRNQRGIVTILFAGVGLYLTARGAADLLD